MNPFKSKEKPKIDVLEDDPFARRKEPKWGWYTRHKMHNTREAQEAIRVEEAFADLKLREAELATMETEEKLCWDSYELPQRNRSRLILERFMKIKKKKDKMKDEEFDKKKQKEQGFTSYNGAVRDFSRFKNSPALFHSFEGHTLGVLSVRLSCDYNYLISCSDDTTVRLWDLHTHKCVRAFEGHNKAVFDCDVLSTFTKLDPMGGRIVSCSADKTLRIWDAVYANCLKVIRGHTEVIYSCCFTPDAQRIASSSADRTVRLWDAVEGHLIYIFNGHNSSVLSCAFSSTGKYLITSSDFGERSIKLWYTDMPHTAEKQEVGFRIQWEVTGLMRRISVKYDPLAGFYKDKVSAQLEMEEEDAADETWALDHPDELEEGELDELAKAEKKAKEEEKLALELPDKSEDEGFSISVNSVDRFGRTSQVTSYYAGVQLSVVLRGVDPFKQFFISAYYKRAQFEIFDEKSGARVGKFSEESVAEIPGARFCCKQQAVCATRSGLDPSLCELELKWTAPSLLDRASTVIDTVCDGGTIVFKATVSRDPLSLCADEVDPGMVQLSFTLNEVDIPKKGTTLSEISQKIEKEEKVYQVDVVSNHQLFIDFARNKDVNSASTLLSERVRMFLEGREIVGQDKVMEVLETLLMDKGTSVVIKDAKLLTNGVTVNSLDRDKSKDAKLKVPTPTKDEDKDKKTDNDKNEENKDEEEEKKIKEKSEGDDEGDKNKKDKKKKVQAVEAQSDESEEDDVMLDNNDDDEIGGGGRKARRKSRKSISKKKNKKKLLIPPGPSEFSNGPPIIEVRRRELIEDFKQHRQHLIKNSKTSNSSTGLFASLLSKKKNKDAAAVDDNNNDDKKKTKGSKRGQGHEENKQAVHEIRLKAEAEVQEILKMRRQKLLVSEEVRTVALLSTNQIRPLELHPEEEPELVGEGKFGVGESHYRMSLPPIYPTTAISTNSAQVNNKIARRATDRAKEQIERHKNRILQAYLTPEETEAMVEEVMKSMIKAEKAKKEFSINPKKRTTEERLPGFEDTDEFNHHHQVRAYELKESYKMNAKDLKDLNLTVNNQYGHFSGGDVRGIATNGTIANDVNNQSNGGSSSPKTSSSLNNFDPLDTPKDISYNMTRRRHMFPTIPGAGTYDKNFSSVEDEAKALEHARNFEQGGLVRTFYIESFGKVHQRAHHNSVNQVVMSLDERRVASASSDTTIRLWDTKSGTLVSTLKGHEHGVHSVAFSDEGTMLLSSGLDNYIILWNVATAQPLTKMYGHDDVVRRLMFFNDSTAFVSCSGDHTAKVWYMTPQAPAPPEKPLVDTSTTTSMLVTWVAPPAFNEEVTAYHLEWRVGIRAEFGNRLTCPGNDNSRNVVGLTPATPYQFRVRAVNRMGEGRWSDPSAQYVTKVDVPDALERPEVVVVTPFSMGIHFKAPTATIPGASISQFVIQLAGAGISFEDKVQRVVSWPKSREAFLNFQEHGVKNNTLSAAGELLVGYSDPARIAKEKRAISQKKMVDREKAKLEAIAVAEQRKRWEKGDFSKTKADLRREEAAQKKEMEEKLAARKKAVEEAAAEDSDYDEEAAAEDKRKLVIAKRIAADMKSAQDAADNGIIKNFVDHYYLFEGLKPGLMYRLRVAGVSTIGMGRWSCSTISMLTAPTEPDAPKPPKIPKESISKFGLTIKWVSPHENGSAVTGFTVRFCHDGSETSLGPFSTELDVTDLDPGCKYTFQVRATNQEGHGPWSPESKPVRTLTDLAEPPNPPEWSVSGIEWIDVVVDMPYANGEPIVSFVVQVREISMQSKSTFGGDQTLPLDLLPEEPGEWEEPLSPLSGGGGGGDGLLVSLKGKKKKPKLRKGKGKCLLHVSNLKADHTYDFRCAAVNSKGISEFGKPSKRARTLKPLAPDAVASLDASEVYPNAIVFSWIPPVCHGAEIESYVIEQVRTAFRPEVITNNSNKDNQNEDHLDDGDDDPEALAKSRAEARDKDMFVTHTCEGWDESKRIDDLTIGNTYKFRISALNSVGAGEFSKWTPEITVDEECIGDPYLT